MRIRNIKPEFFTSEDIAALDWNTRLVFIGLWSYVDDNGVGRDSEKLIAAALFPLEDDQHVTRMQITCSLRQLSAAGLIARYTVDGHRFLEIVTWSKHQYIPRPNRPRYPPSTSANAEIFEESCDSHVNDMQLATNAVRGTEGQRDRGTGIKSRAHPISQSAARSEADDNDRADARRPAKPDAAEQTRPPEWHITNDAYLDPAVNKGFTFVAVAQIVKSILAARGDPPEQIVAALVAIHSAGRPITRQTLCQHLDGHLARTNNGADVDGMSKQDAKVVGYLDTGRRLITRSAPEPKGLP